MKVKVGNIKLSRYILVLVFLLIAFIPIIINCKGIKKVFYPIKYSSYVERYSIEYGVDKYLIYSIIKTESKFRTRAISYKNAKGLMQITDKTADWAKEELGLGNVDIYEPKENIKIGVWYLSRLQREFNGNLKLVVASYNGGSGNVKKWLKSKDYSKDGRTLGNIPFEETSKYTDKVLYNYRIYRDLYK